MQAEEEGQDLVQKFGDAYIKTSIVILGGLHNYLFNTIENYLSSLPPRDKSLLIIGHAKGVLPFSRSPEKVSKMLGNKGRIVLMDYKDQMIHDAISFLTAINFFEKSKLKSKGSQQIENPANLEARTLAFTKGDLRDKLMYQNNSFDCIDVTLAAHHAVPFLEDLDNLTSEFYRILKKGGLLHYGEGYVDMDSETKIIQLASDTAEFFKSDIVFRDHRFTDKPKLGLFEKGKKYTRFPKIQDPKFSGIEMTLHKAGEILVVTLNNESAINYVHHLLGKNRVTIQQKDNYVSFPLIDDKNPEDKSNFVEPIWAFYRSIYNAAMMEFSGTPLFDEISKMIDHEFPNAKKGIIEYYKKYSKLKRSLEKAGFKKINKIDHKGRPFISITAFK